VEIVLNTYPQTPPVIPSSALEGDNWGHGYKSDLHLWCACARGGSLPGVIDALIKAVKAGELDEQLKQSSKSPRPIPSRKVAWVQRRVRFPRYRRSQSLKTAFGDTITDLWAMTTSLDPAELDNLCFGARAIWQSAYAYPITTSKVLHEMALIIVHRSRGQAIALDLGKLRFRLRSPGSFERIWRIVSIIPNYFRTGV
jgi:hypothetical protein